MGDQVIKHHDLILGNDKKGSIMAGFASTGASAIFALDHLLEVEGAD